MPRIVCDLADHAKSKSDGVIADSVAEAADSAVARSKVEYLQQRDSVLRTVSQIAEAYLSGMDTELSVHATLGALGRAVGACRVTLLQKMDSVHSRNLIQPLGEWAEASWPLDSDHTISWPKPAHARIHSIERWDRALASGTVIAGRSTSFPLEEQAQFGSERIRSVAVVPILVDGAHWGQMGFGRDLDEEWHPEVLDALRIAAGIIGAAIRSKRDHEELESRVQSRTLELAEASKALRESEMLHRRLVETSPDAIVLFDLEYRILMANPSSLELFRCDTVDTLKGEFVQDWMWPKDRAAADMYHRELLSTGRVHAVPVTFSRRDGSTFHAEVSAALIPDEAGRPLYILHVTRDVTHQREIEQHLRQAQKMDAVGRLASGIAHDFNNILTVVKGFGELLAKRLEAPGFPHYMATEIVGAADRAAALVEQLLAFSRKQMVEPKVLDVNSAIQQMRTMLGALLREDIELTSNLDPATGSILIDSGQFDQLIVNLLVNARDAMPAGGTVTISTMCISAEAMPSYTDTKPGTHVLLEVRDTGTGMTEEVRSHIFEPFFTTKDVGKGTGLGLATIYGVVQQAGGHVEVDSAPGAGCIFRIYIPSAAPVPPKSAATSRARSKSNCRETILVTENERGVRALMSTTLAECGYTVLEAENGVHALEVVEQHSGNIDLLLTDVVMPQMGGLELWHNLAGRFPAMHVLYTSGHTDKGVANFPAFLRKPFSPDTLLAKVHDLLLDAIEPCDSSLG